MNGIYLYLLLGEIRDDLVGAVIQDIRMKGRIIQLVLNGRSLYISLYPTVMGMYLARDPDRTYEPLSAMSEMVKSCRITRIIHEDFMPVVRLCLEKPVPRSKVFESIISFYPEAPNFSLKTASWQRNIFSRYVEKKPKSSLLHLSDDQVVHASVDYLIKNVEGIDKKMAQEMDTEILLSIKSALQGAKKHLKLVSIDPLHISLRSQGNGEEFSTLNALFKIAITQFQKEQEKKRGDQDQRRLVRTLRKRISRLRRKLLKPEEVEYHRTAGELILSNIARIRKGSSMVTLFDPYMKKEREIMLDPHLTPQANAQKYFARYKKEKRGQPKLREQMAKLAKEITALKSQQVSAAVRKRAVAKVEAAIEPFHKFMLNSGSVILVGKNARSNDQLTFKHARPADYFFHTRGVEGAHVILRSNIPRGQRPRKDEIRLAGAIAAYFSKAKKQRNVPVSYTQRKYLKKAKKGAPGSVIMLREEVVFVDPGIPK